MEKNYVKMNINQEASFTGYSLHLKKYVLNIVNNGIIQEHKTFKRFNGSERLLDRSHCFKMIEGKKASALSPKSWKKSFDNGIFIHTKNRFCNECKVQKMCDNCNNQINENKEFEANLNEKKDTLPTHLVICFLII